MIELHHHQAGHIDTQPGTISEIIEQTLKSYWEDEQEIGFWFREEGGPFVGSLATVEFYGPCEGIVEVYVVGEPLRRVHVKYISNENGYVRTEVSPV